MDTSIPKKETERIEFRVSKEEKELFDHARNLIGLTSLSEFARRAIKKEAIAVVEAEQRILTSRRDKALFFNALMGDETPPNDALMEAIRFHTKMISE
ncbi:MAG: DUF1778 domain-containing protein [Saprospiraceae bacterium]|nr:DUF1778 domain-containing protein [Saprospiraceae bacterium]